MPVSRLVTRAVLVAGAALLLAVATGSASAQRGESQRSAATDVAVPGHGNPFMSTSARRLLADGSGFAAALDMSKQHGSPVGHLPSARENIELVGKLEPTRQFGSIVPEQIADLTVHEGFAYLNSWAEPTCSKGGVYVVDIRNPATPLEVGFIPALPGSYHGEGAQVLSLDTPAFQGDVLAVNNEACEDDDAGGFDLYDVSDPRNPRILVQGFGDGEPNEGTLTGSTDTSNHYHNIRMWAFGGKVYIVGGRQLRAPRCRHLRHHEPACAGAGGRVRPARARSRRSRTTSANGNLVLNHDDVIKIIGGRPTMLLSYWDAGYVKLDVSDPANPMLHRRHELRRPRPACAGDRAARGQRPPGRVQRRQRVPPRGGRGLLAVPGRRVLDHHRPVRGRVSVAGRPGRRLACAAAGPDDERPDRLRRLRLRRVDADPVARERVPDELPGLEEAIVVLQRGPAGDPQNPEEACFPGEKAANAAEAGYDAVLLVNRHLGSADLDEPFCGSGGFSTVTVTMCTTHEAFHHIFRAEPPQYRLPVPATGEPAIGDLGEDVEATSVFDGWGYAHLYENGSGKLRRIDSFAIEEALDERYAFGFGDLSIHECATDPTERPRVLVLLRGRLPGRLVRAGRHRGGRQVHRQGRQQLLGRRAVHDAAGRAPCGSVRPRLRALHLPLHRTRCGGGA